MDFFEDYFKYVGDSESPAIFHRWCGLSTISSMIGREAFLPFGHKPIFFNQYILIVGIPGTRKSSAIGIAKDILTKAGYTTFAKDRSSKERFFLDMVRKIEDEPDLFNLVLDAPSEMMIANGELLDFIGHGNMEFLTALTNLWDCPPVYEHPKLHGKSVIITQPVINILGGATVKGLGLAIPPEALGTGILSRLIMIHADPTGKKITFPAPVEAGAADQIVETLLKIRTDIKGAVTKTDAASKLLDRMYKECLDIEDGRFADYSGRRFTHLLKTSMVIAASYGRSEIQAEDTLIANTVLHAAERKMAKALGEFGKSKYSDVSNTIMEALSKAHKPMSHVQLWKIVAKDLSDVRDLNTIMKNLLSSEKVQVLTLLGKQGYMTLIKEHVEWHKDLLLPDYLTIEERS